MCRRSRCRVFVILIAIFWASPAAGQTAKQLWGELTLEWIESHTLTLKVDVEPKVLVSKPSDRPGWATLDVTPSAEFRYGKWVDFVGELHLGQTQQTDNQDSTEITPRVGVRLHLLSNLVGDVVRERQPRRRLVLRNLLRVEWRNLNYSGSPPQPSSSTVRYRARLESLFPFNRRRVTDDGALYQSSDVEWFWTRHDVPERFASKQRIRAGVGYRWNRAWRGEILYVWDRSRDSAMAGFTRADSAVDFRVHRVW